MPLLINQPQVSMPVTSPEQMDYRSAARNRGDRAYAEHVSALHAHVFGVKAGDLTYQRAKDLCVVDRELWMRFYRTWLSDSSVRQDAVRLGALMEEAISALGEIRTKGMLLETEQEHLDSMIENTALRKKMFDELGKDQSRENIRDFVKGSYSALLTKRREQLSGLGQLKS